MLNGMACGRPSKFDPRFTGFFTLIKELNMNKKLLSVALLGGLAVAQTALAQDYDDRWYVAGSTGINFQDGDRGTEDSLFGTLGFDTTGATVTASANAAVMGI